MISLLHAVTVEPVVFFYVVAIFAEYFVVEDVIYVNKCFQHLNLTSVDQLKICTEDMKHHNTSDHDAQIITAETNKAQMIYNGILYSTSIISSFIAATYADRRSKFAPIFIPIAGSFLVQILAILSLVIHSGEGLPLSLSGGFGLTVIYVCALVSGITGGTSTLISSSFAHVAERCSQSQRTSRITIIEACLFGGGFVGFSYAGSIVRHHPNSLARYYFNFGLFLVIHLLLGCYVFLRRYMFHAPISSGEQWRASCGLLFTSVLHTIFRPRPQRHRRQVVHLFLIAFLIISMWNTLITTQLYIFTRSVIHWIPWKYSFFNSAKFGLCGIFLCALPIAQYLLTVRWSRSPFSDQSIIVLGLLSRGLAIIVIGLSTLSEYLMILALVVIIFSEYPVPAIRSQLSKLIDANEKAQMFVFLATIQSICFFTGGLFFPALFNALQSTQTLGGPALLFVLLGILQFVSLFILCYAQHLIKQSRKDDNTNITETI